MQDEVSQEESEQNEVDGTERIEGRLGRQKERKT